MIRSKIPLQDGKDRNPLAGLFQHCTVKPLSEIVEGIREMVSIELDICVKKARRGSLYKVFGRERYVHSLGHSLSISCLISWAIFLLFNCFALSSIFGLYYVVM